MSPEFRRKDQRGLTAFTARELFLDHLEGSLEPLARAEFEKLLENDVSLRLDYEKFQDAVIFCSKVATFELAPEAREEIVSAPTPLESFAKRVNVQSWPAGLRWGVEALLVVSVLLIGVLVIPWSKIIRVSDREEIVLAEIERGQTNAGTEIAMVPTPTPKEFDDEGAHETSATPTPAVTNDAPTATPKAAQATPTPVAPVRATPTPKAQAVVAATPVPKPAKTERPTIGSLYRGQVDVANLDATTAKFVEQISGAGGRKAGEVELGWEKGTTRYFHFTIPEARYEEFLAFARQYGSVRINREPHPRVMPEGIVRVILVLREQGG